MYITPKGIKYEVGTKFKYTDGFTYTITSISNEYINLEWINSHKYTYWETRFLITTVHNWIDNSILIQDYQSVDPSTIKFDFTNTKIKVNSPEESEWIQKVAFNNGCSWYMGNKKPEHTHSKGLVFFDNNLSHSYSGDIEHHTQKEITIQDILNNQMKEVIEVGDIVELVAPSYKHGTQAKIINIQPNGHYDVQHIQTRYETTTGYQPQHIKLVSKANKQEITGYELLKDLPGIPAGTKSSEYMGTGRGGVEFNTGQRHSAIGIPDYKLQDTTWFKPIYKAKEVIVKISSNREIIVDATHVFIKDKGEDLSFADIKALHKLVSIGNSFSNYKYNVETFKLGCQSFTKSDIELVYQQIKDLK